MEKKKTTKTAILIQNRSSRAEKRLEWASEGGESLGGVGFMVGYVVVEKCGVLVCM